MRKIAFTSLAAMGAIALPAAAQAQSNEDPQVETYVGASVVIGLVLWLGALRLTRHPLQAEIAVTARKLLGASRGVLKAAP